MREDVDFMRTKVKKIIALTLVLVLACTLCGFGFFQKKEEDYRTIRVYQIEGTAAVEREELGSIDAYEGMLLRSGDTVQTQEESWLYFQMDEDKFSLLGPESQLRIEASGTSADSKTYLSLEYGSLVFRVDEKLSPDSVYELNTPNSTMAVRGTSGWIVVRNRYSSNVELFDGMQVITRTDPVSGQMRQAQITGGQRADEIINGTAYDGGGGANTQISEMKEKEVPGFVAVGAQKGNSGSVYRENPNVTSAAAEEIVKRYSGSISGNTSESIDKENTAASSQEAGKTASESKTTGAAGGATGTDSFAGGKEAESVTTVKTEIKTGGASGGATGTVRDAEGKEEEPVTTVKTKSKTGGASGGATGIGTRAEVLEPVQNDKVGSVGESTTTKKTQTVNVTAAGTITESEAASSLGNTVAKEIPLMTDKNTIYTQLSVASGTVACRLKNPEGGLSAGEKLVKAGKTASMRIDETSSVYLEDGEVEYAQQSIPVLEFLLTAGDINVKSPVKNEELEKALEEALKNIHIHSGGTATCVSPAVCEDPDCGESYGQKNPNYHVGGTGIRNAVTATCITEGNTGYTCCTGCGAVLKAGTSTGLDSKNHAGGTEIRNAVTATCVAEGYTGDTYCLGCNAILKASAKTGLDSTNHEGGTEIRNAVTADCETQGYTGDSYCMACGKFVSDGTYYDKNPDNHPQAKIVVVGSTPATCRKEGYSGDTHCTGCNRVIMKGWSIDKNPANHDGGTELRDVVLGTCRDKGYSGNIWCIGCNKVLESGSYTDTNPNNHAYESYLDGAKSPTCCDKGQTDNELCSGCGALLKAGTEIPPTGQHPAAGCGISGHHAHDGLNHSTASCGVEGHHACDGLDHSFCGNPDGAVS